MLTCLKFIAVVLIIVIYQLKFLFFLLDEYGWWFSAEDNTYDPLSPSDVSKGYDESIELVKATFTNQVINHDAKHYTVVGNAISLFPSPPCV